MMMMIMIMMIIIMIIMIIMMMMMIIMMIIFAPRTRLAPPKVLRLLGLRLRRGLRAAARAGRNRGAAPLRSCGG